LFFILSAVLFIFFLGNIFKNFADKANLELRLILETGMAFSALVVLGTAVLIACQGLGKSDDKNSYNIMFAMPINRDGIYLGYLSGLWLTVFTYSIVMAIALMSVVYFRFDVVNYGILLHFFTLFLEGVVLAAIAFLFSLTGSNVVSFFLAIAIAIISHAEGVVLHLAKESSNWALEFFVPWLVKLLPSLGALNVKSVVVRGIPVQWEQLGLGILHNVVYVMVLLLLIFIVRRRLGQEGV
jgi:hypothetical protein